MTTRFRYYAALTLAALCMGVRAETAPDEAPALEHGRIAMLQVEDQPDGALALFEVERTDARDVGWIGDVELKVLGREPQRTLHLTRFEPGCEAFARERQASPRYYCDNLRATVRDGVVRLQYVSLWADRIFDLNLVPDPTRRDIWRHAYRGLPGEPNLALSIDEDGQDYSLLWKAQGERQHRHFARVPKAWAQRLGLAPVELALVAGIDVAMDLADVEADTERRFAGILDRHPAPDTLFVPYAAPGVPIDTGNGDLSQAPRCGWQCRPCASLPGVVDEFTCAVAESPLPGGEWPGFPGWGSGDLGGGGGSGADDDEGAPSNRRDLVFVRAPRSKAPRIVAREGDGVVEFAYAIKNTGVLPITVSVLDVIAFANSVHLTTGLPAWPDFESYRVSSHQFCGALRSAPGEVTFELSPSAVFATQRKLRCTQALNSNAQFGRHYLTVQADPQNVVEETHEDNNDAEMRGVYWVPRN